MPIYYIRRPTLLCLHWSFTRLRFCFLYSSQHLVDFCLILIKLDKLFIMTSKKLYLQTKYVIIPSGNQDSASIDIPITCFWRSVIRQIQWYNLIRVRYTLSSLVTTKHKRLNLYLLSMYIVPNFVHEIRCKFAE
jgi:hypothetical protein